MCDFAGSTFQFSVSFPVTTIKYSDTRNLRKKGHVLVHSSSTTVVKSRQRARGSCASRSVGSREKWMHAHYCSAPVAFPLTQSRIPCPRNVPPTLGPSHFNERDQDKSIQPFPEPRQPSEALRPRWFEILSHWQETLTTQAPRSFPVNTLRYPT